MPNQPSVTMPVTSFKEYTYEEIEAIASFLKKNVDVQPEIGIVCGSGLGTIGNVVQDSTIFDYKDIPNFPRSTVMGHAGRLIFGNINDVPVIVMQGRFHFYEGHSLSTCVMPIRLMKLLGVKTVIISNAAGGINNTYKTGDVMLIKDHINLVGLAGNNPLRGYNDERFGVRFPALNQAYNPQMILVAKKIGQDLEMQGMHEGVYACVGGPCYETVAELRMLKVMGADAVGMSTVHEVIASRHCGMKSFGLSLITNECILDYDTLKEPNGDEVLDVAGQSALALNRFIEKLVPKLKEIQDLN